MDDEHHPRHWPETVVVGEILRPHGVRGEVVVEVQSDVADRFAAGAELILAAADGSRRAVRVLSSRPHRGRALVALEGVEERGAAEALRGNDLEIDSRRVPAAPDGTYYHFELLDCECLDERAGVLGPVVEVHEDGGGLLLEVANGRQTLLVPFVEAFLRRVDVAGRRIELCLPDGLIETCASRS